MLADDELALLASFMVFLSAGLGGLVVAVWGTRRTPSRRKLAQQDELRRGIVSGPENGILTVLRTEHLGCLT